MTIKVNENKLHAHEHRMKKKIRGKLNETIKANKCKQKNENRFEEHTYTHTHEHFYARIRSNASRIPFCYFVSHTHTSIMTID